MQQLANAFERGEDVEYDGRTCGRTSRYALSHYLRSDKTGSLPADFRFKNGLSFSENKKQARVVIKRSDFSEFTDTR